MHKNSELLFTSYALPLFKTLHRVLEVGPEGVGITLHQRLVNQFGAHPTWELTDIADIPGLAFRMCEYVMPVDNDTYDLVLSAQVIEHVRRPWLWMHELRRVCKPGGYVITICPVSWPFHEHPVDCWRIYPDGMQALHDEVGLSTFLIRCESLDGESTDTIAIGVK
jgi:SAM-dependent methyltransferase